MCGMRWLFASIAFLLVLLTGCDLWQVSDDHAAAVRPQRMQPQHPPARGRVETVAAGHIQGKRWWFTAYRSKDGLCVDLQVGLNSGGGCGSRPGDDLSMAGVGWTSDLPDLAQLEGQVSERVAKLTARSGDDAERELQLYPSERFGRTFYVAFVPFDDRIVLTAYDKEGDVLKRRVVPASELDPQGVP